MMSLLSIAVLSACAPQRDCAVVLGYPDDGFGSVSVVGDFNGWNASADPMRLEGDIWRLDLELPAGDYAYLLDIDGVRIPDPFAALLSEDPRTGEERSLVRVADCASPALSVDHAEATAAGALRIEATFLRADARLDAAEAALLDGTALSVSIHPRSGAIIAETSGLPAGKHTVLLSATDADGLTAGVRVPLWVEAEAFSWQDALIYQIVTDRFADADGALPDDPDAIGRRNGGTLAGITAQLEAGYFSSLGVRVLWISPLYDNPEGLWPGIDGHEYEGYHGYWPIDSDAIEPALGSEADMLALVAAAHERGIRVMVDVVPNHVHEDHPWAQRSDWLNNNPDCICGDYTCPWSDAIETCWFTDYLPDLNWNNPEVAAAVVESTVGWVERLDLDGLRIDAVPMMPRAALRELVAGLSDAVEHGPTGLYTLGETFTGADGHADIRKNIGPFGLSGQFDFPVMWAIRELVAHDSQDAAALQDALAESEEQWAGSGAVMAPFLGNHDVTRFLSEAAGDDLSDPWGAPPPQPDDAEPYERLLLAQALLLSLPGAPILYYGDEYGLAGANDPDSRRTWSQDLSDQQLAVLSGVQRLGTGRACAAALRRGERIPLVAVGPLYAHLRTGDPPAIFAMNTARESRDILIPLPEPINTPLLDLIGGTMTITPGESIRLTLPGLSAVLLADPECAAL
jgi:glycosidase